MVDAEWECTMGKRRSGARTEGATRGGRQREPTAAALDKLIEQAIVDAHDESEQAMGFHNLIEENLALPFETDVLGVRVTVENVELAERDDLAAICVRGGKRQRIRLLDLPLPSPPPEGHEWIEAYRRWAGGAAAAESGEDE